MSAEWLVYLCSQRCSHVCRLSKHTEPAASVLSTSDDCGATATQAGTTQARILIALSADQPTLWTIWELVWDAKRPQMVCVQQEKITPQNCLTPPSEVKNRQLYARRKKTKQVGQEPSVFCGNTWQASPCISLSKHHCQSRAGVKELYSLNRAACQTPSL